MRQISDRMAANTTLHIPHLHERTASGTGPWCSEQPSALELSVLGRSRFKLGRKVTSEEHKRTLCTRAL